MPNIKISELSAPIAVTDSDLIPGVQSGVTRRLTWGGLKSTLAGALGRSYLGLGTASTANVTTSAIDTTAGRLTKVGDFGLGLDAVAVADANTIPASGVYRLGGAGSVNGPLPGIFFTLVNYRYGTTSGAQIATRLGDTTGRTWVRAQQENVWGAWAEVITGSKQTSTTDTTAGALMSVGAFGLGGTGTAQMPSTGDANATAATGFYRLVSPFTNGPTATTYTIINTQHGSTIQQIALGTTTNPQVYTRAFAASTWSAWAEVFTSVTANAITVDTGSFGYGTGSGGTVTQATSKATGVTLNKPSGQVTTASGALAANTAVSFTLTNNKIAANDIPMVVIKSGATAGAYVVQVDAVAAGSCRISIRNMTAGSLSETLVLQFNIEKGAIA